MVKVTLEVFVLMPVFVTLQTPLELVMQLVVPVAPSVQIT